MPANIVSETRISTHAYAMHMNIIMWKEALDLSLSFWHQNMEYILLLITADWMHRWQHRTKKTSENRNEKNSIKEDQKYIMHRCENNASLYGSTCVCVVCCVSN